MSAKEVMVRLLVGAGVVLAFAYVVIAGVFGARNRGKAIDKRDLRRTLIAVTVTLGAAGFALGLLAVVTGFIGVPLSQPTRIIANIALVIVFTLGAALFGGFGFLSSLHRTGHRLDGEIGEDIVETLYKLLWKNTDE